MGTNSRTSTLRCGVALFPLRPHRVSRMPSYGQTLAGRSPAVRSAKASDSKRLLSAESLVAGADCRTPALHCGVDSSPRRAQARNRDITRPIAPVATLAWTLYDGSFRRVDFLSRGHANQGLRPLLLSSSGVFHFLSVQQGFVLS